MPKQQARGLDSFRLVAALFVVGIHTFPLIQLNTKLDMMVNLVVGRFAVPFFFMISGYFILGPLLDGETYLVKTRYQNFLKSNLLLYLLMIVLYFPLGIYNGTFTKGTTLLEFFKLLLFDGTFYHLWYLPAIILGMMITYNVLKYCGLKLTLGIAGGLYLIGLAGDSYYLLVGKLPVVKQLLAIVFRFSDFTRNGLFFPPIFLVLSVLIYQMKKHPAPRSQLKPMIGLVLSLLLLLGEGWWLHTGIEPRHDSMYLSLLPLSYYLFKVLLSWQGWPLRQVKGLATWLYFLHPLSIVLIRFAAKIIGLEKYLVGNNLIHYVLVVILSLLLSQGVLSFQQWRRRQRKFLPKPQRAWKELSAENLKLNLVEIQDKLAQGTKVMPVIKANGYGHESIWLGRILAKMGIDLMAVATLQEGITLRKAGVKVDLLILGYTPPSLAKELAYYELIQTIVSREHGESLRETQVNLRTHLKIDTGMHRLGIEAYEVESMVDFYQTPSLGVEGIYSHLGSADSLTGEAVSRTRQQIKIYDQVLRELTGQEISIGVTHLQSSYGILNYPELRYDYVRAGILLYGNHSQVDTELRSAIKVKPVLGIKSRIIALKEIKAGEYLGYGTAIKAQRNLRLGVVSLGYADGLPRNLSNQGLGLSFREVELQQIGNICMDMLLVDTTGVQDLAVGSEVSLIADENDILNLVTKGQTITNEFFSRLGERLEVRSK